MRLLAVIMYYIVCVASGMNQVPGICMTCLVIHREKEFDCHSFASTCMFCMCELSFSWKHGNRKERLGMDEDVFMGVDI